MKILLHHIFRKALLGALLLALIEIFVPLPLSWATPKTTAQVCKSWLTSSLLAQGQQALQEHPAAFLPLQDIADNDLQIIPRNLNIAFFPHEGISWIEIGYFNVALEGHSGEGEAWHVTYLDAAKSLQDALFFISPEWQHNPNFMADLKKAWQSFPAIYLRPIKVWNFPFARFKRNPQSSMAKKHNLKFLANGVALEWKKVDRSYRGWLAYFRPPKGKEMSASYLTTAFAQALAVVWWDALSGQKDFIMAWEIAAHHDQASAAFTPSIIMSLLLHPEKPTYTHRQKILAAAAYSSYNVEGPHVPSEDLPLNFHVTNSAPKANIANVLRAKVEVQEDAAAKEEKEVVRQLAIPDLLPEKSLFWGRNNGVGKLYQVTRKFGAEQVTLKFLIEDFSALPSREAQAIEQIKWITAMLPGKYLQKINLVQILPAYATIDQMNWFPFTWRSALHTLSGVARLRLTTSSDQPQKRDLLIYLEEGWATQLDSPGLAQLMAYDLKDWLDP